MENFINKKPLQYKKIWFYCYISILKNWIDITKEIAFILWLAINNKKQIIFLEKIARYDTKWKFLEFQEISWKEQIEKKLIEKQKILKYNLIEKNMKNNIIKKLREILGFWKVEFNQKIFYNKSKHIVHVNDLERWKSKILEKHYNYIKFYLVNVLWLERKLIENIESKWITKELKSEILKRLKAIEDEKILKKLESEVLKRLSEILKNEEILKEIIAAVNPDCIRMILRNALNTRYMEELKQ